MDGLWEEAVAEAPGPHSATGVGNRWSQAPKSPLRKEGQQDPSPREGRDLITERPISGVLARACRELPPRAWLQDSPGALSGEGQGAGRHWDSGASKRNSGPRRQA